MLEVDRKVQAAENGDVFRDENTMEEASAVAVAAAATSQISYRRHLVDVSKLTYVIFR